MALRIYVLKRVDDDCDYDEANAFVVIASSPAEARAVASRECGDEGPETWLRPGCSSCKELRPDRPRIVVRDFHAG